jgi:hypothetical protein
MSQVRTPVMLLLTAGNLEKYDVRVAFSGVTSTYKFAEIGQRVQMLTGGTHREQGYLKKKTYILSLGNEVSSKFTTQ